MHGLFLSLAHQSGHGCVMYTIRMLGVWTFLRRLPILTAQRVWSARVPCGIGHFVDLVVWLCGECGSAPHSSCSPQHMAPKYSDFHQMVKRTKIWTNIPPATSQSSSDSTEDRLNTLLTKFLRPWHEACGRLLQCFLHKTGIFMKISEKSNVFLNFWDAKMRCLNRKQHQKMRSINIRVHAKF